MRNIKQKINAVTKNKTEGGVGVLPKEMFKIEMFNARSDSWHYTLLVWITNVCSMEIHKENDIEHCKIPERAPPLGEEHPIGWGEVSKNSMLSPYVDFIFRFQAQWECVQGGNFNLIIFQKITDSMTSPD